MAQLSIGYCISMPFKATTLPTIVHASQDEDGSLTPNELKVTSLDHVHVFL